MRLSVFALAALTTVLVSCSSSSSPEPPASATTPVAVQPATPPVDPAAFLAQAAAEPGAVKTASGLIYRELKAGTGASPKATDTVTVNYRGTLTDGTEFDSSYKAGRPLPIPLNKVIPCWTEGVQKMKVGGKSKLTCPGDIAYGPAGPPGIPPNATLVFEVELLDVAK